LRLNFVFLKCTLDQASSVAELKEQYAAATSNVVEPALQDYFLTVVFPSEDFRYGRCCFQIIHSPKEIQDALWGLSAEALCGPG
jgi:hypothetical protein